MYQYETAVAATTAAGTETLTDPSRLPTPGPEHVLVFERLLKYARRRYSHAHLANCPSCEMLLLHLDSIAARDAFCARCRAGSTVR